MSNRAAVSSSVAAPSPWFTYLTAVLITLLVASNIMAVKLVGFAGIIQPASMLIFPAIYVLGAVITEVYGLPAARRVIWLSFVCNFVAVVALWGGGLLPAAAVWGSQDAYVSILGYTPRILFASFIAVIVGEFANTHLLVKMKNAKAGPMWVRLFSASVIGLGVDSVLFIGIAFVGTVPTSVLWSMILISWIVKTIYVVALSPVTLPLVRFLKRAEGGAGQPQPEGEASVSSVAQETVAA